MKKHLIKVESGDYNQSIINRTKMIAKDYNKICYVRLNKPYKALTNILNENRLILISSTS